MKKESSYVFSNINMRDFYLKVMCFYDEFPEVVVVENLENDREIIAYELPNGNLIYYLKNSDNMIDIFFDELENQKAKVLKAEPFQYHDLSNKEICTWISCVVEIADLLNVDCPQIIFWTSEDSGNSSDGRIFISDTHPDNRLNIIKTFVTIAHELRHEWQHVNCPDIFNNYPDPDKDMESYLNHPSEVDAEAFARKLATIIFDWNLFTAADKLLLDRAKDIDIDSNEIFFGLFDELYDIVHSE